MKSLSSKCYVLNYCCVIVKLNNCFLNMIKDSLSVSQYEGWPRRLPITHIPSS